MKDKVFLLMELAEKGNLYKLVKDKPLEEEKAVKFFYQILEGIEYLHSKDVVHRDLKVTKLLIFF